MQFLLISRGHVAMVDDEDYDLVAGSRWLNHLTPDRIGGTAWRHRTYEDGTPSMQYMSRVIMKPLKDKQVVFLNGNGLDFRRDNLEVMDRAHVQRRSRVRRDSTSGIKGVRFNSSSGRWTALLWRQKRCISLGTYDSGTDASEAYKKAVYQWKEYEGNLAMRSSVE